jgi:predicted dehydrogenase
MSGKIKLGVIGTGMAWERLHKPALDRLADKYEVLALCHTKDEYSAMFARDDIDAVLSLVPISENFEVARDVLNAERHLIAEKPFASSPEAARELIALKNEKNLTVLVAENFRYDGENIIIKKILTDKTLGEALSFTQVTAADFEKKQTENTFAAKEWRQHPDFKGGIFLDGGIHDIARMRFLFGDVELVSAAGHPHEKDYCAYAAISALLRFKCGVAGQYSYFSSTGEHNGSPVGLRIFCTGGEIYLESKECGKVNIFRKDGTGESLPFTPEQGYYNELLNFWGALKNGDEIISTPEKELGDIELIYEILRAMA